MLDFRLKSHPILSIKEKDSLSFFFSGEKISAKAGETISSALFAAGIRIFGEKKGRPQGIFCANGQCSQCSVIADGKVVKACMTLVKEGMDVRPFLKPESLPDSVSPLEFKDPIYLSTKVLVIGAGPAGLSCAVELAEAGVETLLIDDKPEAGGKLLMQTHPFFGSKEECYAGVRGFEIASKLYEKISSYDEIKYMPSVSAIGMFSDFTVGAVSDSGYILIKPECVVVATGAREKAFSFPGWHLPGVYGAGAFQTILNRDLVKPAEKLFIIGAGNVGLIAAFHAMQAGIKVCGICELGADAGGYQVHALKLKRLGVPFYFSHTVQAALGDAKGVKSVVIAEIKDGKADLSSSKKIDADAVLLSVGFQSVNELFLEGKKLNFNIYSCGDAAEIAEAGAAMFSGKLTARKVLRSFGQKVEIPEDWLEKFNVMKSRPGKIYDFQPTEYGELYPIIRCVQEIPCNPCAYACPNGSIKLNSDKITGIPVFSGKCSGCGQCLRVCPALSITLFDGRDPENPKAILPYELNLSLINVGKKVELTDIEGKALGDGIIQDISFSNRYKRALVTVASSEFICKNAAGFIVEELVSKDFSLDSDLPEDDEIVCRCESVTAGQIKTMIRNGASSLHELKALLRCAMGPCAGKTCASLIERICRSEGLEIEGRSLRPLEFETSFRVLSGAYEVKK